MKIIITESQNNYIRRRLSIIDNYVKQSLYEVDPNDYNFHDYVEEIAWSVWDKMSREEKGNDEDNTNDFFDFVRDNYWKQIENYYLKYLES